MNILRCGALLALVMLGGSPALAETTGEDRLRAALRDTTRKLHEAQDELAALKAEVSTLRQAAATPQVCPPVPEISPAARRQIEQFANENTALRKYAEEAQAMIVKWQEAQTQWQTGLQQAHEAAQQNEAAAKFLQEELQRAKDQATTQHTDCVAKNVALVQIGTELLEQYRDKGLWDLLTFSEPITQIRRVEFETLLQEYGGKIQENEVRVPEKAVQHGS